LACPEVPCPQAGRALGGWQHPLELMSGTANDLGRNIIFMAPGVCDRVWLFKSN